MLGLGIGLGVRVIVRDRFRDGVRDRMLGFGELGRNQLAKDPLAASVNANWP